MAVNVVSDDEKYYIHLCGIDSEITEDIFLLDDFKDITPCHYIKQKILDSCGYHVLLFSMLLMTHGTDLPTLSYAIMNEDKFFLTKSTLNNLQQWLINQDLMPDNIDHDTELCDDDQNVIMSPLYCPNDMAKKIWIDKSKTDIVLADTNTNTNTIISQFMGPSTDDRKMKCNESHESFDHEDDNLSSCS